MNELSQTAQPRMSITNGISRSQNTTRTYWANLVWKEWHEHKWKSALITLFSIASVLLVGGTAKDLDLAGLICCVGVIFMAMSVVAGERADGTLEFAQSLPIERWKAAFVRMTVSGLLCIMPIIVSALVVQLTALMTSSRETEVVWSSAFRNSGLCLSLYYWITAAAVFQPTTLRVGMIGVFIVLMWLTIGFVLALIQNRFGETWIQVVGWLGPFVWGNPESMSSSPRFAGILCLQLVSITLLLCATVISYGTPLTSSGNLAASSSPMTLGRSRRTPTSALAWLQYRETLPICIAGAALMFVIGLVAATVFAQRLSFLQRANIVVTTIFAVGIPWMTIIAVGTFVPNLQRRLFTFWRSRPIVVGEWYWSKFWTGASVALVSLHLPTIILVGVTQKMCWLDPFASCVGYLILPLFHLMVYSLSVLTSVLFRSVTPAAILSTAIALFLIVPPVMKDSSFASLRYDLAQAEITEFIASGFTTSIAAALPILCVILVVTGIAAVTGATLVERDVSVGKG